MALGKLWTLGALAHGVMAGVLLNAPASQQVMQQEYRPHQNSLDSGPRRLHGRFLHITGMGLPFVSRLFPALRAMYH
jgi:hypothetical protein